MVKKAICTDPIYSLILDKKYTIFNEYEELGEEFLSVLEINNGANSFFSWRFKMIPQLINKNITIL